VLLLFKSVVFWAVRRVGIRVCLRVQVLRHFALLPEDDIEELDHLSIQTATAVQALEAEDAAEAEAPEEFMDPIMSEIMTEPVTLPSGMNIDLATIRHHMMIDETDPFNRCSLSRIICMLSQPSPPRV